MSNKPTTDVPESDLPISPVNAPAPGRYIAAPSLADVKAGNAILQKWHKGQAVSYIQHLLGIGVDEAFGDDTEKAVKRFQEQNGLEVEPGFEGKVGRMTLAALEKGGTLPAPTPSLGFDARGKLQRVHPELKARITRVAEALAARGMEMLVTDGLRTFEEQWVIYKKGRRQVNGKWECINPKCAGTFTGAKGGQSNHNYGLAIDAYPFIDGRVYTEIPKTASAEFKKKFNAVQQAIGEEGERAGLAWGGRWTRVDTPHLQLFPEGTMTWQDCLKIYEANGNSLKAVWDKVDKLLNG